MLKANKFVWVLAVTATMATTFAGFGQGQGQWGQGQGQNQTQNQNDPRHRETGRSGTSTYSGSNNQQRSNHGAGQRVDRKQFAPPMPVLDARTARMQLLSHATDFRAIYGSGCRIGYIAYDRNWEDRQFRYPFYVFNPYDTLGFISPWYFYPNLPAYISTGRCLVLDASDLPAVFVGTPYTGYNNDAYQQGYSAGYQAGQTSGYQAGQNDNRILDGVLDDIKSVFLHGDQKALDHLVPESGQVNIYVDGNYSYSISANDFYDMMRDNSKSTHTIDYQILDTRTSGDEAKVLAAHIFQDPWGDRQTVYHTYLLKIGRRGAQIAEYGTSSTKPW